jgi:glycine cleavage system H protein
VTAINDSLSQSPEQINKDAHRAWMIKMELANPEDLQSLLSAEDYEKYIAEEK